MYPHSAAQKRREDPHDLNQSGQREKISLQF